MQDKLVIYFVLTQCPANLEDKFNKWYNETHVPMLLKSEHASGATRYKIAPMTDRFEPAATGKEPLSYLAIYEFKNQQAFEAWNSSAEVAAARKERKETWGEKGFEVLSRGVGEPLRIWHK